MRHNQYFLRGVVHLNKVNLAAKDLIGKNRTLKPKSTLSIQVVCSVIVDNFSIIAFQEISRKKKL